MFSAFKKFFTKKAQASLLLFFFGFSIAASSLFAFPQPAHAQYTDPVTSVQTTLANVFTEVKNVAVEAATLTLVNASSYFANQIAYSLAVSLTSDCPGQKPCWDSKGFQDGFTQAWQGAVGEAVGTLSDQLGFSAMGLNLCKPADSIALKIQLGILSTIPGQKPRPPKCDFNAMVNNYRDFATSLTSQEVLSRVSVQFEPGQSPLSVALRVNDSVQSTILGAQQEAVVKRLTCAAAGGGFCDVVDKVTGRITTPALALEDAYLRLQRESKDMPKLNAMITTGGAIAKGAVVSVLIPAIQTFVQTLASRLLDKMFKSGLMNAADLIATQPDLIFSPEGILQPAGTAGAEVAQSAFLAPTPQQGGLIDPLLEFTTCPSNNRGPLNCVMDAQLANVIRVADVTPMTVADAIAKNQLHGEWPLLSAKAHVKDQDPLCYTYGYCESNLKKMRAARILPIGWEIAASQSSLEKPVKLSEVVLAFNDCNAQGGADAAHPWCHLIDPDWVLRIPQTMCTAKGYGPELVSSEIPARQQICVDSQTCIKQDDNGTCVGGWGYCLREKNIWRFNGESCPAQYNTCTTLRPRSASDQPVNYLLNTIDFGVCNAGNAGCQNYALDLHAVECTLHDGSGLPRNCDLQAGCSCTNNSAPFAGTCTVLKDQSSCSTLTGRQDTTGDDWLRNPARYFNKDVAKCDVKNVGCSALIRLQDGQSLNLIRNGGFEEQEDADGDGTPDHPKYWVPAGLVPEGRTGHLSTDGTKAVDGHNAVYVGGTALDPAHNVCTLTSACADDNGCTCTAATGDFKCLVAKDETACRFYDPQTDPSTGSSSSEMTQGDIPVMPNRTYTISGVVSAPADTVLSGAGVRLRFKDAANAAVSGLVASTSYTGGVGTLCKPFSNALQVTVSADAPAKRAAFSCTFSTSAPIATASVSLFSAHAAAYIDDLQLEEGTGTPFHEGYNGDATQVADLKVPPAYLDCKGDSSDRTECANFAGICREDEVGCSKYVPKNGDPFVPGITTPQDSCPAECVGYDMFIQEPTPFDGSGSPSYFIPSTAAACSAAEVGCSEFTDVDTEAIAYYSQLRLCQKPSDPTTATYYTWEGSDSAGYQLKVWNLKESNLISKQAAAPAGNAADVRADIAADNTAAAGTSIGKAPCTAYSGQDGTCVESGVDPSTIQTCTRQDIVNGNFDCREFYDVQGNRHFRRLSKTVIATDDCRSYRLTVADQTLCKRNGGRWDASKNDCIYGAAPSESRSCTKEVNGCRSYKGNASSNVRSVMNDDFESGTLGGWTIAAGSPGSSVSTEAVNVGGHSMRMNPGAMVYKDIKPLVNQGHQYSLSFWAKGTKSVNIYVNVAKPDGSQVNLHFSVADNDPATPTVTLNGGWQLYNAGPITLPAALPDATTVKLYFWTDETAPSYANFDNIILKEVQDDITVVRDSWKTPASCDQTANGVPSPQEMLGCRAYSKEGTDVSLRSFTQLCRERAIGCAAYSFTQNTPDPYAETFNAVCKNASVCTSGGGCNCNYASNTMPGVRLSDVCRVRTGEKTCRFHLDEKDLTVNGSTDNDRVIVPADEKMYLVGLGAAAQCPAEAVGCKNLGIPHLAYQGVCNIGAPAGSQGAPCTDSLYGTNATCTVKPGEQSCVFGYASGYIDKWSAATLKDDPSRYDQTLCKEPEVACEEFSSSNGPIYFKSPGDKVCEFKENVSLTITNPATGAPERVTRSGWYQKSDTGELFPCYSELLKQGREYQIYKNADRTCTLSSACTASSAHYQDGTCGCYADNSQVCRVPQNGTVCGYQGWVGQCKPQFDQCQEFVDPLDTTDAYPAGQPYYYLDNDKLDKASCAGKASLKSGCVMFKKTSDTRDLFSAPATYFKSLKTANNAAVSVENCGEKLSTNNRNEAYCGKRCLGHLKGQCVVNATNDLVSPQKLCTSDADCASDQHCNGTVYYGNGCDGQTNGECAAGEVCVPEPTDQCSVSHDPCNTPGAACPNNGGTCAPVRNITANDTNVVLKVRRDRQCGEWLTTAEGYGIYDSTKNRWQTVTTRLGVCDQYFQSGEALECSRILDETPSILTKDDYVGRDTSWRGLDYSGYSLFNKFQPQFLTPVNVNKGLCRLASNGSPAAPTKYCYNTSECNGNRCSVSGAACSAPGNACADNGGTCTALGEGKYCSAPLTGNCKSSDASLDGHECADDSDCSDARHNVTGVCLENKAAFRFGIAIGVCSDNGHPCGSDNNGICYQQRCMYDISASAGGAPKALVVTNDANEQACRAYPEVDSPYGSSVIETNGSGGGYDAGGNPVTRKSGFQGANVCVKGADCECSYQKVTYGKSAAVRYHAYSGGTQPAFGICSGGDFDGQPCGPGMNLSGNPADGGKHDGCGVEGTCQKQTKRSLALGWPGLCIDTDYSMNVNADPDQYSCNLWLPVDQLAGTPDLFNQHVEAGFIAPSTPLMYCQVAQGSAQGPAASPYEMEIYSEPDPQGFFQGCTSNHFCSSLHTQADCESLSSNYNFHDKVPTQCTGNDLQNHCIVTGKACQWNSGICEDRVEEHNNAGTQVYTGNNACQQFGRDHLPPDIVNLVDPLAICPGKVFDNSFPTCNGTYGNVLFSKGISVPGLLGHASVGQFPQDYDDPMNLYGGNSPKIYWKGYGIWLRESETAALQFDTTGGRFYLFRDKDNQADVGNTAKHVWTFAKYFSGDGFSGPPPVTEVSDPVLHDGENNCAKILDLFDQPCLGADKTACQSHQQSAMDALCDDPGIKDSGKKNCIAARAIFAPEEPPLYASWATETVNAGIAHGNPGRDTSHFILSKLQGALCMNSKAYPYTIRATSVKALMRESCEEVAVVASERPKEKAVAWTDRMWSGSSQTGFLPAGYSQDHAATPFGRVSLVKFNASIQPGGDIIPNSSDNDKTSYDKRAYRFNVFDPYSSDTNLGPYPLPIIDADGGSPYTAFVVNGDPATQATAKILMNIATSVGGLPYACSGPCKGPNAAVINKDTDTAVPANVTSPWIYHTQDDSDFGKNQLKQLFARVIGVYKYNDRRDPAHNDLENLYTYKGGDQGGVWDERVNVMTPSSAPHVVQLDEPCNDKDLCFEGNEGLTVEYEGAKINDRDVDVGSGIKIYLKFFMYADKDHMPISRLIIDNGDGSDPAVRPGLYRNQRGLYHDTANNTISPVCGSKAEFGLQPQACDQNNVREEVHYICNPPVQGEPHPLPSCDNSDHPRPCRRGDGKCVFKPRVQVMDNWDICNGSCTHDPAWKAGKSLCANQDPLNGNGAHNECGANTSPPPQPPVLHDDPWTYYSHDIIVSPTS